MVKVAQVGTWTLAAVIVSILGIAAACGSHRKLGGGVGKTAKVDKNQSDDEFESEVEVSDGEEPVEVVEQPAAPTETKPILDLSKVGSVAGFKDNDALVATFFALTKVTKAEVITSVTGTLPANVAAAQRPAAAQAKYDGFLSQLATGESPAQQTPAVVASSTKLAAHFCDALTTNVTLRSQVLPGVDFAAAPAAADLNKIAEALIKAFWPMGVESAPDIAASVQMLAGVLGEIRTSATATPPTGGLTTQSLVLGGCAIVLTAAPVTML